MVLMPIFGDQAMIYHASKQVGKAVKLREPKQGLINKVGKSKPMPRKEKCY